MTNKSMLSVPRELLERIADHCKFWANHPYLEAISDIEKPIRTLLAAPTEDVRAVVDEPYRWLYAGVAYSVQPHTDAEPLYRHPQRPVVMPERRKLDGWSQLTSEDRGWNACLDELKRLNPH